MSEFLPQGTVTLLLADVEGSTRLWENRPDEMSAAIAALDRVVAQTVTARGGVRPVEQGEGDSFVAGFGRASDAVACALELQLAPLGPIRLRIGLYTGEVQMRDEGNYVGPVMNRAARLRDLAHGGQTVLSAATEELVVDRLADDVWLIDLGSHQLRGVPRPERVWQLCHVALHNEFPPLRTANTVVVTHLPMQLTSFVGRVAAMDDVQQILTNNQVVTLTGVGGVGKTRMAVEIAAQMAGEFGGGVWFVDLAPVTDPDVVPVAVARTLTLSDRPGPSTMDMLIGLLADRQMLVVLDNCEHLLDACATLVVALCGACPGLSILATSREPIGVPGEVTLRVPSLSLAGEAIELFSDRARRARPDFSITGGAAATVTEICRRLDGLPLAIELAAARVRTLSLTEILDSLHDRFRLLTGGARTAVRRQQTLWACVDWSHALMNEPERVLFRRLAAFMGGFDLEAVKAVGGADDTDRYQVLDQLSLLVDKSLVVADVSGNRTRYRMLETVRQYARKKLDESGEAESVRTGHRDHYLALATQLDAGSDAGHEPRIERAEDDIDNLRAALTWSLDGREIERALRLASALQSLWLARGHIREGLAWLDAALTDGSADRTAVAPAVWARGMADKAALMASIGAPEGLELAEKSLTIAREIDDPALLARALTACISAAGYNSDVGRPYFTEALALARVLGDDWRLSQIFGAWVLSVYAMGDPSAVRAFAEEGREVAEAIGDLFRARQWRWWLGWAQFALGDPGAAAAQFQQVAAEAEEARDGLSRATSLLCQALALSHRGDTHRARDAAEGAIEVGATFGGEVQASSYAALATAGLAAGDVAGADEAIEMALRQFVGSDRAAARLYVVAEVALARGDLGTARRWADQAVSATTGFHLMVALTTRARVAIAQDKPEDARRYAHEALARGAEVKGYVGIPDIVECIAGLAVAAGHREAARLFGAAQTMRQRMGLVRFKVYDAGYEAAIATLRNAMDVHDFDSAWAEGTVMSLDEAVGYAKLAAPVKRLGSADPHRE